MSQPHLQFFFEGDDYFNSLWKDLNEAKYSISIETYILADDEIGNTLKDILIKKSGQGVHISLMIDSIGSYGLNKTFINELKDSGISFKNFHPLRSLSPLKQINKRDHRKIVIIDSIIGYLGGINFTKLASQKYSGLNAWRDTQIRITGSLVNKMIYHFKRSFKSIKFRSRRFEKFSNYNDVVATRNFIGRNHIRRFIHRYITRSRHRIAISSAYFIPDIVTMRRLIKAKNRGVHVQILTCDPQYNDVRLVHRIQRPLLKSLIKRGVEIYFYQNRMMHAKSIVFDEKFSTIGSSNINYRSFYRDLEMNIFLRQEKWAKILIDQFENDLKNSRLVTFQELKNVSWIDKGIDMLFYLIRSFF